MPFSSVSLYENLSSLCFIFKITFKMFVTAGVDLKFHDITETFLFGYKPLQSGNITSVSWSKDNGFLTILNENAQVQILSLKDRKHIKTVHLITAIHDASVVAFQRTTKRLIGLGTSSGQVILYDTKNKAIYKQFGNVPGGAVNLLDFNNGDMQMAASCVSGTVFLYDVKHASVREMYTIPNNCCSTSLRFHPTEKDRLLLGIEDGSIAHWSIETGAKTFSPQLHTAPVTGLALINNPNTFVSVGYDHKFCIHDITAGTCTFRSNLRHPLTSVDANSGEYVIAIGTLFGDLYIYDVRNLIIPLASETPHESKINKIAFENNKTKDMEGELSSVSLHQPKIKFVNDNFDANVNNSDINVSCYDAEAVSKLLDVIENQKAEIKFLRQEVSETVRKNAEELQLHIAKQMGNLQDFILSEIKTICDEIEDKFDFQNFGLQLPYDKEENNAIAE